MNNMNYQTEKGLIGMVYSLDDVSLGKSAPQMEAMATLSNESILRRRNGVTEERNIFFDDAVLISLILRRNLGMEHSLKATLETILSS